MRKAEDAEKQPEGIPLAGRVHSRVKVRKPQEPDGGREEKEEAGDTRIGDGNDQDRRSSVDMHPFLDEILRDTIRVPMKLRME